jgi:hypothetical protein
VIIEGVRLHEVDDVEPVLLASLYIPDLEIIPLGAAACVVIWFQDEIVFVLIDLNCPP